MLAQASGDFLMTYDNDAAVAAMAAKYGFDTQLVAMKNTHHACMTELLIGRNLGWARS
jgi:DNA adenine methylase